MNRPALLFLSAALLLCPRLPADTITLKSGEKVEGKVLSETDTDITLQVQISPSIKDERTISKSEIEGEIQKRSEDSDAFDAIKGLRVNDDHSFPAEAYEQMLTGLGSFAQQYPLSEHIADVRAQMAGLQEEQKRVQNGELKYHGQWLSAAEAEREKYQIEAEQTLGLLKTYGQRADYSNALNTFDLIQTKYPGARSYPDAVDYVKEFLPSLYADAQRRANALKIEQQTFLANMKFRPEPGRSQTIAAAQREQSSYTAMMNGSRAKWKPYIGRSNTSLGFYLQQLPGALTALATVDTAPMRQATGLVAQARSAMAAKDIAAAQGNLKNALALWPASEEVARANADLTQLIAETTAAAQATPTPAPSAVSSSTPIPATAAAASSPAPSAPSTGGSFLFSLPGALTVLAGVLILAGAAALLGRRKPKNDDEI